MAGLPAAVHRHLAAHLEMVTRKWLLRQGFTSGQIDGWLARAHLVELQRGVYGRPSAPETYERKVYAAVLRSGRSARADGPASLRLHAVKGWTAHDEVGVAVPRQRRVTGVDFPVTRTTLPRADCARVGSIPALSPIRALLEAAAGEAIQKVRVAFDDLRRRRLVTVEHAERRTAALPDLPGAMILADLLGGGALEHESEAERDLLASFLREVFPDEQLEWQVEDLVPGRRLDAAIRRASFGFEYNGKDNHLLPTDRDEDELRRMQARAQGVEVLFLTKGMIVHRRIETTRRVRAAFERQLRELVGSGESSPGR